MRKLARSSWNFRSLLGGILCLLVFGQVARAYDFDGNNKATYNGRPRWLGMPIVYQFNELTSDTLNNITNGSDPKAAVKAGFDEWTANANVFFEQGPDTSAATGGVQDGVNLITFADTPGNRQASAGAIAITLFVSSNNQIIDADIIFNPSIGHTTLGDIGRYQIQSSATHEIGHFLGLEHSAIWGATMWPFRGPNGAVTGGERSQETPSSDDRAGINQLYPLPGFIAKTGGIRGTVKTSTDQKVYGAHVVAINLQDGITYAGNNSLGSNQGTNYGTYEIQGLPGGKYQIYAEPMDGPTTSQNWSGSYSHGDYWGGSFTQNYKTTFSGGNASPRTITVYPRITQLEDIIVDVGTPSINPRYVSISDNGDDYKSLSTLPLDLLPGDSRHIVIFGSGMDDVANADITCSDPKITIDFSQRKSGKVLAWNSIPYTIFQISIPSGLPGGSRSLRFKLGNEVAVLTGGISVDAPEILPFVNEAGDFERYE